MNATEPNTVSDDLSNTLTLSNLTEPTSLTTAWDELSNTLTLSNSTEPTLLTTVWDDLSNTLTLSNSTEPTLLTTAWDDLSNTLQLSNSTEPTSLTTAWDDLWNNLTGVEDILSSTSAGIESLQRLSSHMKTVFVTLGIILNLLGVIGNGSILCVIVRDKTLRKPYNGLLASMAVHDMILCGVLNMTQVVGIHSESFPITWPSEDLMCKINAILWSHFLLTSMLHIIVIAAHRYLLVFHPRFSERITSKRTISLLIVVLHVVSLPLLSKQFTAPMRFIRSAGCCLHKINGNVNLIIFVTVVVFAITALLYSYIRIHRKVYSTKKRLQLVNTEGTSYANQKRKLKSTTQHKKILQCMVIILVTFIAGYVPSMFSVWRINRGYDIAPVYVSTTVLILWTTNAINSLIYGVLDSRFRNGYKKLFLCNNKISPTNA